MTFRQILSVTLFSTVMLCACTNETEDSSVENEYVNSVRVSVERFKDDLPTTRTNHILTSTGLDVQWAEGDALGIYPIGGDQVKFPLLVHQLLLILMVEHGNCVREFNMLHIIHSLKIIILFLKLQFL